MFHHLFFQLLRKAIIAFYIFRDGFAEEKEKRYA